MEDNWSNYGFSSIIGPKLRELVQNQLADELNSLLGMSFKYDFHWSESCIEGHYGMVLDGSLENYLGIILIDKQASIKANG